MNYELFMGEALAEARTALALGERPIAAVAVVALALGAIWLTQATDDPRQKPRDNRAGAGNGPEREEPHHGGQPSGIHADVRINRPPRLRASSRTETSTSEAYSAQSELVMKR